MGVSSFVKMDDADGMTVGATAGVTRPGTRAGREARPERGVVGFDRAPVRGTQCVQSVGAGVLDCPAVESHHHNNAPANT